MHAIARGSVCVICFGAVRTPPTAASWLQVRRILAAIHLPLQCRCLPSETTACLLLGVKSAPVIESKPLHIITKPIMKLPSTCCFQTQRQPYLKPSEPHILTVSVYRLRFASIGTCPFPLPWNASSKTISKCCLATYEVLVFLIVEYIILLSHLHEHPIDKATK